MATGKRYYWIKLKKSFFTSDCVDYLMSQDDGNGSKYVVLYQLLCLKTINTRGKLERRIGEVVIPYDPVKIQRDCKWFDLHTVRVALDLYKSLGLIYIDEDGKPALTDYDSLVGSETDYANQKKKQRESGQCPQSSVDIAVDNVHTEIDIRDRDIEIETRDREIEDDGTTSKEVVCRTKDVRRIVEAWNTLGLQTIVKIAPETQRGKMLKARIKEYGLDAVMAAIEKVRASEYLRGKNGKGWTVTFDWFVKPNNFPKVLEGNYDAWKHHDTSETSNVFLQFVDEEDMNDKK